MTLRKILAIIIALSISVSFCACSSDATTESDTAQEDPWNLLLSIVSEGLQEENNEQKNQDNASKFGAFVVLSHTTSEDGLEQYIMYDPQTLVMYSFIAGHQTGAFGELYNADGTLKLYSPEDTNETE